MVRYGLLLCLLAILSGPLYTEPGYSTIQHSISELAAQNTDNAWIMRLGLLALSVATIWGYAMKPILRNAPFAIFGIFMALSALLPHKPFIAGRPYSELLDIAHSAASSLAGFSAVVGFLVLAFATDRTADKLICGSLAVLYTALPLGMLAFPQYQGILQRTIFFSFIIWAFFRYPLTRDA